MRVPQEIRQSLIVYGLDCDIWNYCWISFWMHFGRCLGRLGIVKTYMYQVSILLPFWIIVPFWCGSSFGPDLGSILKQFWHHRGFPLWTKSILKSSIYVLDTFWAHLGGTEMVLKKLPKSSKNMSQNMSPTFLLNSDFKVPF